MARLGPLGLALVLVLGGAGLALGVEGDVVFKRQSGQDLGTPPAVFPHWAHRIRFRCYACHPPIEMKAGAQSVTMDDIMAGKSCGTCHNGKVAWAVTYDSCGRCHVAPR